MKMMKNDGEPMWEVVWAENRGERSPKIHTAQPPDLWFAGGGLEFPWKGVMANVSDYNLVSVRRL